VLKISGSVLKINNMTAKKSKTPPQSGAVKPHTDTTDARNQAERDIDKDPELNDPDPTDDLDEGELARKDNAAEDAAI
jgi:hypothetical protein